MRRLAKHSRDDQYATRRDYQEITDHDALSVDLSEANARIVLQAALSGTETPFYGFGGYIKPSVSSALSVTLLADEQPVAEKTFALSPNWNRIGLAAEYKGATDIRVIMQLRGNVRKLGLWGIDCGFVSLPGRLAHVALTVQDLTPAHLCPETLYLPHAQALNLRIDEETSSSLVLHPAGSRISLKKCAYCGRKLPVDRKRPGAIAFHRHGDKVTGHQNECRSCKKWRINKELNSRRTTDQLHESSVLTRERKLLLHEPEILQRIKNRHSGKGLKSIVWQNFGKSCFRCGKPLKLKEVQLDHTRPLAYLYPIDEHATCLCDLCNNFKKDRFPVDVYNDEQLRELSRITKLPYAKLKRKDINEPVLREILADITRFADTWTPRMFNSTARRVKEMRPEIDLFEVLRRQSPAAYDRVIEGLKKRPAHEGEGDDGDDAEDDDGGEDAPLLALL